MSLPKLAAAVDFSDGEPLTLVGEARFSQSLERGLAILECFTAEQPLLGISQLAEMLGMSRSTTHRYVTTLVELGYLKQGAQRKYSLRLNVTKLGMSAMNSMGVHVHARPYIEELSRSSGFTVALAVLDGSEIIYVDRVLGARRGQQSIELGLVPGARLPAYCTALGKLLIAELPAQEQRVLLAELELERCGPQTIASKSVLRSELNAVLAKGLATEREEFAPELLAIAVPVRSESREAIAAVGMAAHSALISLEGLVGQLGPHLVSTADRISARLGYRRDDERAGGRTAPIASRLVTDGTDSERASAERHERSLA